MVIDKLLPDLLSKMASEDVIVLSSDSESYGEDNQENQRKPVPELELQPSDEDEDLLDPDDPEFDLLRDQQEYSTPGPSCSSSSQPPQQKVVLKPAKVKPTKPKSKPKSAAATPIAVPLSEPEDDDEEEPVMSYRVTLKNPNPHRQKKTTTTFEKELKKAEREQRKADQLREKHLKKIEAELRKNSRPGEAVKFMLVLLDPNFVHKTALEEILRTAGIQHSNNVGVILPNSILFERETVYQAMGDDLQLHKKSRFDQEDQMLVYLDADDIVPKIAVQTESDNDALELDVHLDLVTYVASLQSTFPKKEITLLVYGMETYFKKIKKNEHQEFRDRVLNAGGEGSPKKRRKKKANTPIISRFDFQNATIELQLKTGVNYRVVNSVKDLGLLICQYTKAFADAPFKRAQREMSTFDWYALADTNGSIKVEKDTGQGLSSLWREQLQQFNKIGIDSAQAIIRKHPTPLHLMEAYDQCKTQEEGQDLLKDLNVCTGFGPLQKTRKLGPEASKKLFRFFTSTDPERCIGSTHNF